MQHFGRQRQSQRRSTTDNWLHTSTRGLGHPKGEPKTPHASRDQVSTTLKWCMLHTQTRRTCWWGSGSSMRRIQNGHWFLFGEARSECGGTKKGWASRAPPKLPRPPTTSIPFFCCYYFFICLLLLRLAGENPESVEALLRTPFPIFHTMIEYIVSALKDWGPCVELGGQEKWAGLFGQAKVWNRAYLRAETLENPRTTLAMVFSVSI